MTRSLRKTTKRDGGESLEDYRNKIDRIAGHIWYHTMSRRKKIEVIRSLEANPKGAAISMFYKTRPEAVRAMNELKKDSRFRNYRLWVRKTWDGEYVVMYDYLTSNPGAMFHIREVARYTKMRDDPDLDNNLTRRRYEQSIGNNYNYAKASEDFSAEKHQKLLDRAEEEGIMPNPAWPTDKEREKHLGDVRVTCYSCGYTTYRKNYPTKFTCPKCGSNSYEYQMVFNPIGTFYNQAYSKDLPLDANPNSHNSFRIRVGSLGVIKFRFDSGLGKWVESTTSKKLKDYGIGGKTYMGYLTPQDILQWIRSDFRRIDEEIGIPYDDNPLPGSGIKVCMKCGAAWPPELESPAKCPKCKRMSIGVTQKPYSRNPSMSYHLSKVRSWEQTAKEQTSETDQFMKGMTIGNVQAHSASVWDDPSYDEKKHAPLLMAALKGKNPVTYRQFDGLRYIIGSNEWSLAEARKSSAFYRARGYKTKILVTDIPLSTIEAVRREGISVPNAKVYSVYVRPTKVEAKSLRQRGLPLGRLNPRKK